MIVEELAILLQKHQLSMGTAESCTGGKIAHKITSQAGSSAYFKGGIVSYCNEVKQQVLGVSSADLEKFGAVSRPVVEQMALGAIRVLNCDCAVATSGIAGPGGGTQDKPVGLVWVGVSSAERTEAVKFNFNNDRLRNTQRFAASALDTLRKFIASR